MNAVRFLIDTSGLFRILQKEHRAAWADFMAAGVIAVCPVVELEFLYSARSLADRLHKQRLLREVFTRVPMSDRAYERADEIQQRLTERAAHRSAGPPRGLRIADYRNLVDGVLFGPIHDVAEVSVDGRPDRPPAFHVAEALLHGRVTGVTIEA